MNRTERCEHGMAIGLCVVDGCHHNGDELLVLEAPEWFPSVGTEFACIKAAHRARRQAERSPADNLAHLIGEAISDDVDAYDIAYPEQSEAVELTVTRDGREFYVTVVEVETP